VNDGSQTTWTERDLARDPHQAEDKAQRIEQMFAAIAPWYDLNNRLHSLWRDQAWRRTAVRAAKPKPSDIVLDAACGTGDLTMAFARANPARVIGIDFTVPMLQLARDKSQRPHRWAKAPHYQAGDAMCLPIADAAVDIVSIAFGIRNVADPAAAIGEFYRVLRPGGRLIVLEFSQPRNPLVRLADRFYREKVMPITATWIARDRSGAYRYLPRSVSAFTDREGLAQHLKNAGFSSVTQKPLTFGVAVCYRGLKN